MNNLILFSILICHISIIHYAVIPVSAGKSKNPSLFCENIKADRRFDCLPKGRANHTSDKESCISKGCCWQPAAKGRLEPWCFFPTNFRSYVVDKTSGPPSHRRLTLQVTQPQAYRYPATIEKARVEINHDTKTRLRINITDAENPSRFKPPYPQVPVVNNYSGDTDYEVLINNDPFGFAIVRKKTGKVIFDTRGIGGLTLANQFLQISSLLPTKYVYGLGERRNAFLVNTTWENITLFNFDFPPQDNTNLYGSHPFYLAVEDDGSSHGVFLLNSNAMDIIVQPAPAITYRTIGGVLDFYFFLGPTPGSVIQQYLEVIGYPVFPPYWSFGFGICRWGWESLEDVKKVWTRNREAGIPFDVMWNDIDYMEGYNDFTIHSNYTGMDQFVDKVHAAGMKYVVILDPGVASKLPRGTYPPYDKGLELNIFVQNSSNLPAEGSVWNQPKGTVYPDFSNPKTESYWFDLLEALHKKISYDGLWLDMNEPSNIVNGSLYGCKENTLDKPPYLPGVYGGFLHHRTLCMSDKHAIGPHYDVHNIYALLQSITTYKSLQTLTHKRPFILSRATFAGSGHYAIHWSGDVKSTWSEMKHSVTDIMNFNLFGIPMIGADICGFMNQTTIELCQRWSQLGAFYPLSRNHNINDTEDQDPAAPVWGKNGPDLIKSTKNALYTRYRFLPYFYTLFWRAHQYGETVIRPLFFDFPADKNTLTIDTQFMWGPAIMILPVLTEEATSVRAFFPKGRWINQENSGDQIVSNGEYRVIDAPLDKIPVYLRGGYIVPWQEANVTTSASRHNHFGLRVTLDEYYRATGSLFWDDGESFSFKAGQYNLLQFNCTDSNLTSTISHWGYNVPMKLGSISVSGLKRRVSEVKINGKPVKFSHSDKGKVLDINQLDISMSSAIEVHWS